MSSSKSGSWLWDPDVYQWYYYDVRSGASLYQDGTRRLRQLSRVGPLPTPPPSVGGLGDTVSITAAKPSYAFPPGLADRPSATHSVSIGQAALSSGAYGSHEPLSRSQRPLHQTENRIFGQEYSPQALDEPVGEAGSVWSTAHQRLYPEFKVRKRQFFVIGRVFRVCWAEPAGNRTLDSSGTPGHLPGRYTDELIYSKVRQFVVIREGENYCTALPIVSRSQQDAGESGAVKTEHALICTGEEPRSLASNSPSEKKRGMQQIALKVRPDGPHGKLDSSSRLDLCKVHTIPYNLKVESCGMVHENSLPMLLSGFKSVFMGQQARPTVPGGSASPIVDATSKMSGKSGKTPFSSTEARNDAGENTQGIDSDEAQDDESSENSRHGIGNHANQSDPNLNQADSGDWTGSQLSAVLAEQGTVKATIMHFRSYLKVAEEFERMGNSNQDVEQKDQIIRKLRKEAAIMSDHLTKALHLLKQSEDEGKRDTSLPRSDDALEPDDEYERPLQQDSNKQERLLASRFRTEPSIEPASHQPLDARAIEAKRKTPFPPETPPPPETLLPPETAALVADITERVIAAPEQAGHIVLSNIARSPASEVTVAGEAAKIATITSTLDKIIDLRCRNSSCTQGMPSVQVWEDELGRFRMFRSRWMAFLEHFSACNDQTDCQICLNAVAGSLDAILSHLEEAVERLQRPVSTDDEESATGSPVSAEDYELLVRHQRVHESISHLNQIMKDYREHARMEGANVSQLQKNIQTGMAAFAALKQHMEADHTDLDMVEVDSLAKLALSVDGTPCPVCGLAVKLG